MVIASECRNIVRRFGRRGFSFQRLNKTKMEKQEMPYTSMEMLKIVSYLERNYQVEKMYLQRENFVETIYKTRGKNSL